MALRTVYTWHHSPGSLSWDITLLSKIIPRSCLFLRGALLAPWMERASDVLLLTTSLVGLSSSLPTPQHCNLTCRGAMACKAGFTTKSITYGMTAQTSTKLSPFPTSRQIGFPPSSFPLPSLSSPVPSASSKVFLCLLWNNPMIP